MLESRLMLESATGLKWIELLARPAERLDSGAAALLRNFVTRRINDEPIGRILGWSGFFGLDLLVTSDVLDPRTDTEVLVEAALAFVSAQCEHKPMLRILDLGTGSGAILCALLSSIPDAIGVGVDLSTGACQLAQINLNRCGLAERSSVVCGDWINCLSGQFDLIVANPPYISLAEKFSLPSAVVEHDPALALFGGEDGLECYRQIARDLRRSLKPEFGVFLEIGWAQADAVREILFATGLRNVGIIKDAAGRDRVVTVVNA
jgi:release factor glutamine methyltransferase